MAEALIPSSFTADQRLALNTSHHAIVRAAAGSGKTRVLVERYVQLLVSGADIRQIVAITFTRKAAAEMIARIAHRLEEYLDRRDLSPDHRARLLHAQSRLSSARVSTIHAFCAQLLREYPVEAGVSPDFVEIGSGELQAMRERAIQHVLERRLADCEQQEQTRQLLLQMGQRAVQSFLDSMLKDSEQHATLQALYREHGDEELIERGMQWLSLVIADTVFAARPMFSLMLDFIQESQPKHAPKVSDARQTLDPWFRASTSDLAQMSADQCAELLDTIAKGLQPFLTKEGKLLKTMQKGEVDPPIDAAVLKNFWSTLSICQTALTNRDADLRMLEQVRILQSMAEEAMTEIQEEKDAISGLDFDDLQLKTLAVLEKPEVRRRIRRSIRYLMVDEFQDTNQLQYQITTAIVGDETQSKPIAAPGNGPNIFIVGDPKQSIYGFRKADVRVFSQAGRDILEANETENNPAHETNENKLGDVRLAVSFRMTADLVAVVNRLCRAFMNAKTEGYEVEFEEMMCGRRVDTMQPARVELIIGQRPASVKTVVDSTQELQSETSLIAARIRSIINHPDKWPVWDDKLQGFRPAAFSDIAILSRTSKKFTEISEELRRSAIPFHRHSGKGFYQTQEVLDVQSLLHFLHSPDDDLALGSVLRSPFFALNDLQLLILSSGRQQASMWSSLAATVQAMRAQEVSSDQMIIDAYERLRHILNKSRLQTVSETISLALSSCAWSATVDYSDRADQMRANMDKLLAAIRSTEERGFRSVYDIITELEQWQKAADNEAEASVLLDENAVNIMTIHAAKGLEFPIVIIVNCITENARSKSHIMSDQLGMCFRTTTDTTKKADGVLMHAARHAQAEKNDAEEKRVLYVALTRARDHLIMSGELKVTDAKGERSAQSARGFWPLIMQGINRPISLFENSCFSYNEVLKTLQPNGEKVLNEHPISIETTVEVKDDRAIVADNQEDQQVQQLLTQSVQSSMHSEVFSASQLMTYSKSPEEYFRTYILGLPASDDAGASTRTTIENEDRDSYIASEAGTIIHSVLARFSEWESASDAERQNQLQKVVDDEVRALSQVSVSVLRQRMMNELTALSQSSLLRRYSHSLMQAQCEHSLTIPLAEDFLHGIVDCILVADDGVVEIWDWKTNRLDRYDENAWFEVYRLQLRVYCYLVACSMKEVTRFRARLVFTRSTKDRVLELNRDEALAVEKEILELVRGIKFLMGDQSARTRVQD